MTNQTLTFGKFKGQKFNETPKYYQDWLLKQDWFKVSNKVYNPSKEISNLSSSLKNWNGYSKSGQNIYDSIFEAEKAEENLIFNDSNTWSSRYDGSW
jgi:hypothetical protein